MSPLRLYYRGSIVRRVAPDSGPIHERLQAGCELVGAAGPEADAEILALAATALHALGVKGRISLGSTGYFSALAAAAGASPRLAAALNDAVDRKDLPTLRTLCEREVVPGKAREAILMLAQPPRLQTEARELLARAEALAPSRTPCRPCAASPPRWRQRRVPARSWRWTWARCAGSGTTPASSSTSTRRARRVRWEVAAVRHVARAIRGPSPAVGFSLDLDALVPLAC